MLKKGDNNSQAGALIRKSNPLQAQRQISNNPLRASGTDSLNSRAKFRSGLSQNPLLNKLAQRPEKTTIEFLDWKNSFYYKHLLVRHESDEETFEKDHLLKSDEHEYLLKVLKSYKSRKPQSKESEMQATILAMQKKAEATVVFILKELLGEENYMLEYTGMQKNQVMQAQHPRDPRLNKVLTLENYLTRIKELKTARKDVVNFLEIVHQRELTLKQMHIAVNAI